MLTSVHARAFGMEERFACAYRLVSVTNRFQISSVKYLQKRLSAEVLSSNGTVEPGISLYRYKILCGSSSPSQVPATSGRAQSVSDVVDVPCVDALRPLPRPVPGRLLRGVPRPLPCVSPLPVDPFPLPVTAGTDGEL